MIIQKSILYNKAPCTPFCVFPLSRSSHRNYLNTQLMKEYNLLIIINNIHYKPPDRCHTHT